MIVPAMSNGTSGGIGRPVFGPPNDVVDSAPRSACTPGYGRLCRAAKREIRQLWGGAVPS